ncbi:ABC transporter permease [Streptomyces sp. NPDC051940]|uniref:ABC transporter permease n=1 Tax=Streptomyces sp. NPDC051940 TaxID=3155675 RepID=UPI00342DDF25
MTTTLAAVPVTGRTSTAAVLRSELIKLRSLRGTWLSLSLLFVLTVGFSWLTAATTETDEGNLDPLYHAFFGILMGQVAAISFGAMAVSSEFHGGALRVSLAAVPRRGLFYGAKLAVTGALALAVGLVCGFASFLGGQALRGDMPAMSLGDEGVLRACVGTGLYTALIALFAAGLTALLRSGTATLSILIPCILILPFVLGVGGDDFTAYLPDRAGQMIFYQDPTAGFGPWTGMGILALWSAAAVAVGWWSMSRRDA